jgi:hypothetical protein
LTYSSEFNKTNYFPDGLLGMAFPSLSIFHAPPLFQTLFAQSTLTQPQFAFKSTETGAELYLGGINAELYIGNITYIPLLANHVS